MTTFVNNFYGTTLSVSPDGLILYAGRGQDSAGVRAYNINTGALIDTYPGFASLQVLLSA